MNRNSRSAKIVSMAQRTMTSNISEFDDDSVKDPDYVPSSVESTPGYLEVLSPKSANNEYSVLNVGRCSPSLNIDHYSDSLLDRFLNDVTNSASGSASLQRMTQTSQPTKNGRHSLSSEISIQDQIIVTDSDISKYNILPGALQNNNAEEKQKRYNNTTPTEKNPAKNIGENITIDNVQTVEIEDAFHMSDTGKLPFNMPEYLGSKVATSNRNKRIWDKRDFCLYCFENVTNFSRHLMRKHNSEIAVQQFMNMKMGSIERKHFIDLLRKKGNFLSPAQKEIKIVKRPTKHVSPEDILPCLYCHGYYMKRYLKRHANKCPQRPQSETNTKLNAVSDAQTYLAFRCVDEKFVSSLRIKERVLNMRCDSISLIAKSDPLILSFGSFYAKRHRHNHLNKVTKNKLRELARLWQNMKLYVNDNSLFEALKPENFKYFTLCTQNITGFNHKTQKFEKAPSLALHMGTTLKQLCNHAFSEIQQKNMIFIKDIDSYQKAKEIKTLRQLVHTNWNAEVSSVANQDLVENQWKKPTIIPLTSDIKKLNNFVKEKAARCVERLKKNEEDRKSFNDLQKCCYTLLITLNRRRIGELERLQLESYLQERNDIISEEFKNHLTKSESILLRKYKRIRIRGKRHKPVPVLFSEVQEYITLLLLHRKKFISPTNPFLFATVNKDTCLDGYSALRTLAKECGAEYHQALTSGKLRKHIATISQIGNLDSVELEQLCTFLGHTVTTHQNFYRLPQEIYQTAKLAKLLLKSQDEAFEDENMNEDLITDDEGDNDENDINDDTHETDVNTLHATEPNSYDVTKQKDVKGKRRCNKKNRFEGLLTGSDKMDEEAEKHRKEQLLETKSNENKVKYSKIRWMENQKRVTREYFKLNIENKKPPTESQIEEFKTRHDCMKNKNWKKIKAFVFNEYRKQ